MEKRSLFLVLITIGLLLLVLAGGWFAARTFIGEQPSAASWQGCEGKDATSLCVQLAVKRFHDVDYSESKDLAKTFLTLLIGVFVASVTFSEKIVDFRTSGQASKMAMLVCWLMLLTAIVSCGLDLCYITSALYQATYDYTAPYALERDAGIMVLLSGTAFVLALLAMLIAALPSLFQKRAANPLCP